MTSLESKTQPETVLYVGYGANRDLDMIRAITGQEPEVVATEVKIKDVELCVQKLGQITDEVSPTAPEPISPLGIMEPAWENKGKFETYGIRTQLGSEVGATLFRLTRAQRQAIAEWELVPFDWYQIMSVDVALPDGAVIQAETEGFDNDQAVDRVVDGGNYITYLSNQDEMLAVAEEVRPDFIK